MDNTEIAEFLLKYSDWIKDGTAFSVLIKAVSGGFIKILYKLTKGLENVVDEVLRVFEFLDNGVIGTVYDSMRLLSISILTIAVIYIAYKWMMDEKVNIKGSLVRTFFAIFLSVQLPGLITYTYDLSIDVYDDTKTIGSVEDSSLSYNIISQNLVDLEYVSEQGFSLLDNVSTNKTHNIPENNFNAVGLAQVVFEDDIKEWVKNAKSKEETEALKSKLVTNSDGTFTPEKLESGMFKVDEGKFRFSYNTFTISVALITMAIAFLSSTFILATSAIDLVFLQLMFPVLSGADIETGQRMKKMILDIGNSFLTMMLTGFSLAIFTVYFTWINTLNIGIVAYLVLCLAGIKMTIDGPNFFGKYLGIDVGVKSGYKSLIGAAIGAKAAVGGAKAIGSTAKKAGSLAGKGVSFIGNGVGNAVDSGYDKFSNKSVNDAIKDDKDSGSGSGGSASGSNTSTNQAQNQSNNGQDISTGSYNAEEDNNTAFEASGGSLNNENTSSVNDRLDDSEFSSDLNLRANSFAETELPNSNSNLSDGINDNQGDFGTSGQSSVSTNNSQNAQGSSINGSPSVSKSKNGTVQNGVKNQGQPSISDNVNNQPNGNAITKNNPNAAAQNGVKNQVQPSISDDESTQAIQNPVSSEPSSVGTQSQVNSGNNHNVGSSSNTGTSSTNYSRPGTQTSQQKPVSSSSAPSGTNSSAKVIGNAPIATPTASSGQTSVGTSQPSRTSNSVPASSKRTSTSNSNYSAIQSVSQSMSESNSVPGQNKTKTSSVGTNSAVETNPQSFVTPQSQTETVTNFDKGSTATETKGFSFDMNDLSFESFIRSENTKKEDNNPFGLPNYNVD